MTTPPNLAARTCAVRLDALGVFPDEPAPPDGSAFVQSFTAAGLARSSVDSRISWHGPAAPGLERPGSEATVQAMSGLMHLHGRDWGGPARLGLEIASVAAGVLAAQGVLAALIGRSRGKRLATVETSVLQAGLLQASHYIAAETCSEGWVPAPPQPDPGPPFGSADGRWFEIETLNPDAWKELWTRLGADVDLGLGWTLFRPRYFRGTCSLPPGFHQATRRYSLAELAEVAASCGVSFSPVRGYPEVVGGPDWQHRHPVMEPLGAGPDVQVATGAQGYQPDTGGTAAQGLPLAGLQVLEATSRMQGPLAGLLLQMLGASVVRVDPPGGDFIRAVPPLAGDTGSFFACFNRGKQAVELDLRDSGQRSALVDLAAGVDVFIHNWRPGKAAEWDLDASDMASANPRLIYVQASGWGSRPGAPRMMGTDFLVQAYTGAGQGLHPDGEPPFPSRVLLVDFMGALVTCEGALAGLYRRELEGAGCRVDTSLLAGGLALQAHILDDMAAGREVGRHRGRPLWGCLDRPVRTADGLVAITVDDTAGLGRLCQVCHVDPSAQSGRATEELVVEQLATGPAAKWEELLAEAGIPCAAVCTDLSQLPADPRLSHLFEPIGGTAQAPVSPWNFAA
jgi:crotonobetainyl-CoA:carnitine CoA-transferase CaiB-like acyl-CoA transferase